MTATLAARSLTAGSGFSMSSVITPKSLDRDVSQSLTGGLGNLGGEAVQFSAEVFISEPAAEGPLVDAGTLCGQAPVRDILNKPFLLETCRTWQRRGRRPRSGRSLPPLSPLRLVPDRASGSLVQAGRLAGKAAGRTTPSVVPPPPAGCPGRTATPGAPCSWPAPGSAPCRIRTAASTAGTDAPL